MDYQAIKFWFDIAQTVLIAVIGLQNWLGKRQAATKSSIERLKQDVDERLEGHIDRLARVEQNLTHSPNKQDFFRVHERLDKFGEELAGVRGEFHAANTLLQTLHQFLMNNR